MLTHLRWTCLAAGILLPNDRHAAEKKRPDLKVEVDEVMKELS